MNRCMVCKQNVASQSMRMDTPIPLLGTVESTNGWVTHSDCLFRLILHPDNNFIKGLAQINKLCFHTECEDARCACIECQQSIAEVLGIPLGLFKLLKAYILRVEKGINYQHNFE